MESGLQHHRGVLRCCKTRRTSPQSQHPTTSKPMKSSSSLVSVYPHVGRCGNVANMGERRCASGRRTDSVGIKIVSPFIQELRIECSAPFGMNTREKDSHFSSQFCEGAVVTTVTWMIQRTCRSSPGIYLAKSDINSQILCYTSGYP